jgi:hypothetical protein
VTAQTDFDKLAREFGPMIRRIVASYEADQPLAEDLLQDIMCVV